MSEGRVLVAEDDPQMQRLLQSQLTLRGYDVKVVDNGKAALAAIEDMDASIVLLDITMPELDGLEVCRQLREYSLVPVILVTAADSPHVKVSALEIGADDYMTKPFHMGELVARMRAVQRRSLGSPAPPQGTVNAGDLVIDLPARTVHRNDEEVRLTKIEFDLLKELVTHGDRILTYDHLLMAVWGPGYDDVRPIHVHICNLRRKLEQGPTGPRYIMSVPGVGYRFALAN